MTSASQVLPSLLCLAFGGAGFLWLSEPAPVGAGERRSLEPAALFVESRPAVAPSAAPTEVRSGVPRAALAHSVAADPIDPAELDALRQRLDDQKERRRDLRQYEREREEALWLRTRAGQLAAELQLPADSAERLASIFIEERDKQSACWNSVRTCGATQEARQRLRDEMKAIREWRAAELVRFFGAETAQKIEEAEKGAEEEAR